jgi:ABC-type antimicrobial peptide transport system permease subunit
LDAFKSRWDRPRWWNRRNSRALSGPFGFLIFRVGALQAAGMGILGLLLAIVGVHGVVSYGASLRTREMGIRAALGARPQDVRRMIVRQGLQLAVAGVVFGLAVAVGLGRLLARLVPLIDGTDWAAFLGVAAGLTGLVLWSCSVPARRAARVPIMDALRHE